MCRKLLSEGQINILIEACETLKERVFIALIGKSLLRPNECLHLKNEGLLNGVVNICTNHKIRMEREIWIPDEVTANLYKDFSDEIKAANSENDYTFAILNKNGILCFDQDIKNLFPKLLFKTGIKATSMSLRHSGGALLAKKNFSPAKIRRIMGLISLDSSFQTF